MPLLDVTDILSDPDFADTITVIRTVQVISSGGIASDGNTQTFPSVQAVVQPDKGRSIQRLAEGARVTDAIKIYTTFVLTAGSGPTEADAVVWNGGTYVVVNVRDWSRFGAGYVEAIADLTDLNP